MGELMSYLLLIIGFILLIKGSDLFVEGSSRIAAYFKIPNVIIGLTLVAFGTSAPEAAVSITAILNNSSALSVSNIIGSNIFNLLIVLGFTSLFKEVITNKEVIVKDYMISLGSAILLFSLIIINYLFKGILVINRINGIILLICLIIYLSNLIKKSNREEVSYDKELSLMDLVFTIGGLGLVIFGGHLTVSSSIIIAREIGISERVIGLTIIAMGTSLPELFTSLVAIIKGKNEIAVGNIIGSNIFNILFILGISSFLKPVLISLSSLIDIVILIGSTILVYYYFNDLRISRKEGLSMIIVYLIYCYYLFVR